VSNLFSYLIRMRQHKVILILFLISAGTVHLCAQNPMAKAIDFSCINCRPEEALNRLSEENNITIPFSSTIFADCPPITVEVKRLSIAEALNKILTCSNTKWKWENQQVLVYRERKQYSVGFKVSDQLSGEIMIGATVRLSAENKSFTLVKLTNEYGFVSFNLPDGNYSLTISLLGYNTFSKIIAVERSQTFRYALVNSEALNEIVVKDISTSRRWNDRQIDGAQTIPKVLIKSTAGAVGLSDVQRVAALSAGVQTGVDGLGGINVRGGNADQNLFLLDDAPILVPSHALGILSVFNAEIISNAKQWKGDAPARYTGRTAGIMDVRSREGNMEQWKSSVHWGLFAGSIVTEGPIKRQRSSALLALRHSSLSPWLNMVKREGTLFNASTDQLKYKLADINAKFNWVIDTCNRVYFSMYSGLDQFSTPFGLTNSRLDNVLISENLQIDNAWGNLVATLRWNHLASEKLFSNTILRFTRFNYKSDLDRVTNSLNTLTGRDAVLADYSQRYNTYVQDVSLRNDFTYFGSRHTTLRFGGSVTHHIFRPGATIINNNQDLVSLQNSTLVTLLIDSLRSKEQPQSQYRNWEMESYFELEKKILDSFSFQAGASNALFFASTKPYFLINPQAKLLYQYKKWNGWAAFNSMSQTIHQIGSFSSNFPFELWVPSTRHIRPQRVNQIVAGASYHYKSWSFLAEAYRKRMKNQLTLVSDADVLLNGGVEEVLGWEHRTLAGNGMAYGYEFTIATQNKQRMASVNYTWSKSTRQFDGLNGGDPFPYRFDRRHELKLHGLWRCSPKWTLSAVWVYASGSPITLSGSRYVNNSQKEDAIIREVFTIDGVNGYRLPAQHRLDVAANYAFAGKKLRHELQIGAYNLYNQKNVLYLQADLSTQGSNKTIAYTLFPILPVFRYVLRL
jgi:TonB-dependent Receptor Plug Domain